METRDLSAEEQALKRETALIAEAMRLRNQKAQAPIPVVKPPIIAPVPVVTPNPVQPIIVPNLPVIDPKDFVLPSNPSDLIKLRDDYLKRIEELKQRILDIQLIIKQLIERLIVAPPDERKKISEDKNKDEDDINKLKNEIARLEEALRK